MVFNLLFFNRCFDKGRLKDLVFWSFQNSGETATLELVEKLKDLGFQYATNAGISLSLDDLKTPPNKPLFVSEAEIEIQSTEKEYQRGNVTSVEKFQQLIDTWHRTSETLKQNVVQHFQSTDILNPVYMMAFSGARGNLSQVRQLVGMRGLMADPQGQIIDFPIRSNFREGLTLTEYVISCYGARKGVVDTALRTATSGYLTRRLVDVAQHIIVSKVDCRTKNGIFLTDMKEGNKIILSLQNRLIGRILAETISFPDGLTIFKNREISSFLSSKICKIKKKVLVRSSLTCEAKNSVCQRCYGWSLAFGKLVFLGEAVGIIAAQSIGEPGTQLTMRTFHTGGVFSGDVMNEIRAPYDGIVYFPEPLQGRLIRTAHGKIAFLTKVSGVLFVQKRHVLNENNDYSSSQKQKFLLIENKKSKLEFMKFEIPPATILFVRQGERIFERQVLAEFSSTSLSNQKKQQILTKHNLNSDIEGDIFFDRIFLTSKKDRTTLANKLGFFFVFSGKIFESGGGVNVFPIVGDLVDKNSFVNKSKLIIPYSGIIESF
uniref:DNA-directed RNA polymerase n=1 Tax=Pleurastrosarcina brevispinosa TaxID=163096 RepID=A0A097KN42_9CHLO|nr:beta'' subunit of RNA polymerase [Chlorosarcina brevispinosa]